MKLIPSKKPSVREFAEVSLSDKDDEILEEMKHTLDSIRRHFEKGLKENQAGVYNQTCDVYVRILEEQRKREMLRSLKP